MKGILAQHDTFPKLLVRNAERFGDRKIAMREKEFGIWQEFTWKEYHDHVKYFSLGLVSLGLSPGDKVAIIGDNRPEWVWAEVAAQAAGAIPLGLYQGSTSRKWRPTAGNWRRKIRISTRKRSPGGRWKTWRSSATPPARPASRRAPCSPSGTSS